MRCVPLSIAPKSQTRGISRRRHIFFLPSWGAEAKQNTQGFSSRVSRRIQTSSKIFAPITADRVIIYFLFLPPSHARTAEARGLAGLIKSLYSTKPRKKIKKKRVASVFTVCAILGFDHWALMEVTKYKKQLSFFCLRCYLPLSCPLRSPSSPSPCHSHSLSSLSRKLVPALHLQHYPQVSGAGCGTECEVISLAWFYQSSFSPGFWTPQSNLPLKVAFVACSAD